MTIIRDKPRTIMDQLINQIMEYGQWKSSSYDIKNSKVISNCIYNEIQLTNDLGENYINHNIFVGAKIEDNIIYIWYCTVNDSMEYRYNFISNELESKNRVS